MDSADPADALRAAIEARRAKQEARARAIEAGEMSVEDPREKRLKEMKSGKAPNPGPPPAVSKRTTSGVTTEG
eukprot:1028171-Prymnesium_polylepis.1